VLACNTYDGVCMAIKTLAVRGAPALGVAAALAVALWSETEGSEIDNVDDYLFRMSEVVAEIVSTRPTAVNLFWGAARMRSLALGNSDLGIEDLRALVVQEALNMIEEDEARNRKLGEHGAELLGANSKVLTHCNAGSLATVYFGTALGVIFTAFEQGKIEHVWVDETRPVNQGGRLTAWELRVAGIPSALITDNMAASVMKNGWVDAALGDGSQIEIEERDPREVEGFTVSGFFEPDSADASRAFDLLTKDGPYEVPLTKGHQMVLDRKGGAYSFDAWFKVTPPGVQIYNPAFDVTPAEYITAIITERGVIRPEPDWELSIGVHCMGAGGIHELDLEG